MAFGRSKRKEAAQAFSSSPSPAPSAPRVGGYAPAELQVFDGKGHRAVMVFTSDSSGRWIQRLRKGRDWNAHLPHIKH